MGWVLACQGGLSEEVSGEEEPKGSAETALRMSGSKQSPKVEARCKAPPAFRTPGNYETINGSGLSRLVWWKCVHSNR